MKILGIDEAGRGSVLGSMFICGIVCVKEKYDFLKNIGVKDSKSFGQGCKARVKRSQIAMMLQSNFPHLILETTAKDIDNYVFKNGLNLLERKVACQIIDYFEVDAVLLDGKNIFSPLQSKYHHATAIDKGDIKNIVIAAASILAKNSRDQSLAKMYQPYQKNYGEIKGGGYANNNSAEFMQWHLKKYDKTPSFYRKSYKWNKFTL